VVCERPRGSGRESRRGGRGDDPDARIQKKARGGIITVTAWLLGECRLERELVDANEAVIRADQRATEESPRSEFHRPPCGFQPSRSGCLVIAWQMGVNRHQCQTARNRDPGSACKRDPSPALGQACPGSE
jgi:hypothetical protein